MKNDTRLQQELISSEGELVLSPELIEMELTRIRDFIKIMEEHEAKLEREFKFKEAAQVRTKINLLKKLEEDKFKSEIQKMHDDQKAQLEIEKAEELRKFNDEYDALYILI